MLFYIIIIAGHFDRKFPLFIFIFLYLSRSAPKIKKAENKRIVRAISALPGGSNVKRFHFGLQMSGYFCRKPIELSMQSKFSFSQKLE